MTSLADIVPSGVVTGDNLLKLLEHARANSYAIPAVNCTRYAGNSSTDFCESFHFPVGDLSIDEFVCIETK